MRLLTNLLTLLGVIVVVVLGAVPFLLAVLGRIVYVAVRVGMSAVDEFLEVERR